MATRIIAGALGLFILAFVAVFAWGGLRGFAPSEQRSADGNLVASLSEQLSEGKIEAQVYVSASLAYRIDIMFSPEPASTLQSSTRPDASLSMVEKHMDGIDLALDAMGDGAWRAQGQIPMAGRWIMNVGFGEEFADVTFEAR